MAPCKKGALCCAPYCQFGAGDEARTRYLHLGKVALYQMSYTRKWCLRSESNQRHGDFQSPALPTELQRHISSQVKKAWLENLATRNRLELSTSSVTGWRANRLHHRAILTICGGNNRARTCDPLLVRQMLSQLSYAPDCCVLCTNSSLIISNIWRFVNRVFKTFSKNFYCFIFARISRKSSGVN